MPGSGVIANVVAVIIGCAIGLTFGRFITERFRKIAFYALGLSTFGIGASMVISGLIKADAVGSKFAVLVLVVSLVAGGLLGAGRIVVVWDKGFNAGEESLTGVEAVFSLSETADDVIVRMAERETGPVTIVTADRELKSRVREHKGRSTATLPTLTLFEGSEQSHVKRRPAQHQAYGGLPKGHADITKELTDVWLPKEGS